MRKIRRDNTRMSECGRTSWSRCRLRQAGFDECKGCTLVKRTSDNWKMIENIPHKRCSVCGEFLPLSKFYKKKRVMKSGRVYEGQESVCKMCRSSERKRKLNENLNG